MPNVKTALVLSGGGFKGAFQVGAIEKLIERNVVDVDEKGNPQFDLIAGISAGSINGSLIAAGRYKQLKEYWNELKDNPGLIYTSDFIDKNGRFKLSFEAIQKHFIGKKPGWFQIAFRTKRLARRIEENILKNYSSFRSIAQYDPLYSRLKKEVTLDRIQKNNTHFICGCCSLETGDYHCISNKQINNDKELVDAIFASSDMPIIWEPIGSITYVNKEGERVEAKHLVDGGLRNSSPIADVIDAMQTIDDKAKWRIIIINNNSGKVDVDKDELSLHYIADRSLLQIILAEIFNNDVDAFRTTNELVKASGKEKEGICIELDVIQPEPGELATKKHTFRYYDYLVVQPKSEELGKLLDTSPKVIEKRISLGEKYTEQALNKSASDWGLVPA